MTGGITPPLNLLQKSHRGSRKASITRHLWAPKEPSSENESESFLMQCQPVCLGLTWEMCLKISISLSGGNREGRPMELTLIATYFSLDHRQLPPVRIYLSEFYERVTCRLRSLASHTVELAPWPSFVATWYRLLRTWPSLIG